MADNQPISFAESIREARQRFAGELRAQAEQIQKLTAELTALEQLHERTEEDAAQTWDEIARVAMQADTVAAEPKVSPDEALDGVLGAVRNLGTSTMPEQVFAVLTEEAAQWDVRAAVFDVRGRAAWGASAHGFGAGLPENVIRSLIIQLAQDTPFRHVCETAGPVEATADTLRKNRNVLDKLKPAPHAPILLLPIRSAGTVSAIFYADPGEKNQPLPINALKILAEFAGAQIDRLIALSGGVAEESAEEEQAEPAEVAAVPAESIAEPAEPRAAQIHAAESVQPEPAPEAPVAVEAPVEEVVQAPPAVEEPIQAAPPGEEPMPLETPAEAAAVEAPGAETGVEEVHVETAEVVEPPVQEPELPPPPVETVVETPEPEAPPPLIESQTAQPHYEPPVEVIAPPPPPIEPPIPVLVPEPAPPPMIPPSPVGFDVSHLSESEQKVHKDARRFARLLVSEIELYNKTKVADGRRNRDLYKRLKSDIDRSRQTFDKRFGKLLDKHYDYLHDELIKTLALGDASLLGPEFPGPAA